MSAPGSHRAADEALSLTLAAVAAVDWYGDACDKACGGRAKEPNDIGDLCGFAEAFHRGSAADGRSPHRIVPYRAGHARFDPSGRHGVHPDIGSPGHRQRLGQLDDAAFA